MHIELNAAEQALFENIKQCAEKLAMPCWLIGGFVRDKLLGRPTKDADLVCIGDGIALAHAVAQSFTPTPPVSFFKTFGTAQVKLPWIELEFVGARKESYQTDSRKPLVEPGTLEDDQNRRDFTINALAISLNGADYGTLIDPFNGVLHLAEKRIKTPLDPAITFSDDPLRMMRGIRFAAQLGFEIDFQTFQAIKAERHRIEIVSQERITDELNKIVLSPKPSIGFDLLYRSGLLHIIFPEMVALAGAEYIDGKGHKDNFLGLISENLPERNVVF
ncbi:MAG: CCA tRNA nucleotidyltransferase, partial [Bacteroidetes bacterium]